MKPRHDLNFLSVQRVAEALLWLLIAFVPWPFGTVSAASEAVVALLLAALGLCLVWRFLFERREFVGSWTLSPLLALLAVVLLSLLPLPTAWVHLLSPNGVQLRRDLLAHLPLNLANSSTITLSFYPYATAHMARLMISSLVVLLAVINFCRCHAAIIRLFIAITAVGGVLGAQAVLQTITSNGMIYWTIPAPVKSTSGPFVNYNNFCQFMNLCLGAGIGLLLNLVHHRSYRGRSHALLGRWELLGDAGRRFVLLLFVMLLLAGLSVLLSTSRGGALAMVGGGLFIAVLLVALRDLDIPLKTLSLVGLSLVCLLLFLGLETFLARMQTLSDLESASGARWQVFQDVWHMVPQFALVGTGLGTHEFVYPMFSHLTTWRNAQFVENEYLQLLEEMGLVGTLLVASFIALLVFNFIHAIRRRDLGLGYAAVGLGYGLVAIALGSITDFGQRLASIATLTAVVCGLIIAIRNVDNPTATPPRRLQHSSALALSLVILALLGWTVSGATRAALAEHHCNQVLPLEAQLVGNNWQGSPDQYTQLITHAQAAADWDPGNVEYQTWLGIYRWHDSLRDATWNSLNDPQRAALFEDLIAKFQQCQQLCPTYGLSYSMAGQIRYMGLHDRNGAAEIRTACMLAPTHKAVCFVAGHLNALEAQARDTTRLWQWPWWGVEYSSSVDGQWAQVREQFQRALALHYPGPEIFNVLVQEVERPDLAVDVFRDDWETLYALADVAEKNTTFADLAPAIRTRAHAVLQADAQAELQKPHPKVQTLAAMADLLARQGDLAGAVRYYRSAIVGSYGNAQWHFALAKILAHSGQTKQALEELGISLRQNDPALSDPQRKIADQLRWDLTHPAAEPARSAATVPQP
jgi:O-antigen ligase